MISRSHALASLLFVIGCAASPPAPPAENPDPVQAAWKEFLQDYPGKWTATWSESVHLPRMIFGAKTNPFPGDPETAARTFLEAHRALFALEDPLSSLGALGTQSVRGLRVVAFQYRHAGIDVHDAEIRVGFDDDDRIVHVSSSVQPVRLKNVSPRLGAGEASSAATKEIAASNATVTVAPRLVILPGGGGRLAYLVFVAGGEPKLPYRILLDAETGEVIQSTALVESKRPTATGS